MGKCCKKCQNVPIYAVKTTLRGIRSFQNSFPLLQDLEKPLVITLSHCHLEQRLLMAQ